MPLFGISFAHIFFSVARIIISKTLIFTAVVFAWVLMHRSASVKTEIDCKIGGH